MADNNQDVKKERKPLKLGGSGATAFNPNQGSTSTLNAFVGQGGFQPGFQPNYNQGYNQNYQGGYQGGYQQGNQYGGFNQNQGGYQQQQQGGFAPYDPTSQIKGGQQQQQQPKTENKPSTASQQNRPTTSSNQGAQQQAKSNTTQNTQGNKTAQPQANTQANTQAKKPEPKQPEPKADPKKETKKGGKVEAKTKSDTGKKGGKEEKKDDKTDTSERSYTKLANLLANQKNVKVEKGDPESALKEKAKYDEVPDETRVPFNIVFIGHVDAGKSTTCGQILLLTDQVDQADVRKLKQEAKEKNRESWWIAYLMDIGDEEKAKGKTVEVGKARFNTDKKRFTILDAPGHKNYVPNMIQGASQADVACLVISAKTGEFESGFDKGGQTVEHAMLAKSLGVRDLIVLVNKMDENTINWSQDRYNQIKKTVEPFLKNQCGYDIEKNVYWVPYSGLNGENMKSKITDPKGSWYKGPTFFELLDNLPNPDRDPEGPVRIPILDKYKDGGNTYVFGRIESGVVVVGQKLTLVPIAESITIHAIYNDSDKRIPYAKPGESIKLHIKGIEDDYINRGDIIASNHSFPYVCTEFECEINITELPEHKAIMSTGYNCVIHLHSALEEVYIKDIKSEWVKAEEKYKPVKYLKAGSKGIVVIATKSNHPVCCEKAEVMSHLGRFTLRDEGKTIASGLITRVKPVVKV